MEDLKKLMVDAEEGDAGAQLRLGEAYEEGQGVPMDLEESAKWYRLAADQKNADAQLGLGLMYYEGKGMERDYSEAAKWLCKAVENGSEIALYNLAFQYQYGEGVPQDFERAEELYIEYLWLNNSYGFVESQLGALYRDDSNPRRDDAAALRYHEEAAVFGDEESLVALGDMYRDGATDLEVDYETALYWYRKAAEGHMRSAEAHFKLGQMYVNGQGVDQDYSMAYMYFELATMGQWQWEGCEHVAQCQDDLAAKMTSEEIITAQELVEERAKPC